MHPEVLDEEPSRCPECGMKLVPAALIGPTDHVDAAPHHEHHHEAGHAHDEAGGIEWEDDMVEVADDHPGQHALGSSSTGPAALRTPRSTGASVWGTG